MRDKVVVVLDGPRAVRIADDPDHVQVALGDRLERSHRLSQLQEHAVAVERALGLATGLEVVGDHLQHLARRPERAQAARAIADAQQRLAQVEVRQRGLVRPPDEPLVAQDAFPLEAGRRRRPGGLQLDRGQRRVPHLREDPRRLAPPAQMHGAERPLERPILDRKVPLRVPVAAQRQEHIPRLPPAAQRQVGGRRPIEPRLVVPALGLVVLEQLAVQHQRLARAALAQRLLRPLARLYLLGGGHD